MKLSKILFGLATAAMFAACSSDEIVQSQPEWNVEGEGYMAFRVSMPALESSRATTNDQFADGRDAEFAVNDMILLLFQGTTEAGAQLKQAYNVSSGELSTFGAVSAANVSSDKVIVQKIKALAAGGNIYAFVVLNKNNVFSVDAANQLSINGVNVPAGTTFAGLKDIEATTSRFASEFGNDTNGFLMMNAPLCSDLGGGHKPTGAITTLATVDPACIKPTHDAAKASPAARVYVERAVAKVTVKAGSGTTNDEATSTPIFDWNTSKWTLNNTNTTSYVLRNMTGFDAQKGLRSNEGTMALPYRFVGHTPTDHTGSTAGASSTTSYFRTYFAQDPNYSTAGTFHTEANPVPDVDCDADSYLYCAENVFNVDNQKWSQTTRAIVELVLSPKTGYSKYALNEGDASFLTEEYVKTKAYNMALEALKADPDFSHVTGAADFAHSTITIGSGDEVTVQIAGFTSDHSTEGDALIDAYETTGKTYTSTALSLKYYTGGKAYYQARIKHFGNDLTPWNTWETGTKPSSGTTTNTYPNNASNRDGDYLGRYGVLRNNWYVLNVNTVSKLGYVSPEALETAISSGGDTPDDELDNWIAIDVNILSWAQREQDVDF